MSAKGEEFRKQLEELKLSAQSATQYLNVGWGHQAVSVNWEQVHRTVAEMRDRIAVLFEVSEAASSQDLRARFVKIDADEKAARDVE